MTTPAPPQEPPAEQALVALEEQTSHTVRNLVFAAVAAGVTAAALLAARDAVTRTVRAAVRRAVRLGAQAAAVAARAVPTRGRRRARPVPAARRRRAVRRGAGAAGVRLPPATVLEGRAVREIGEAFEQGAAAVRSAPDQKRARVVAERVASRLEAVTATAVNQAASAGVDAVARQAGADGVMWVAERDGCLTCAALSGRIVRVGERFPQNRTFGDKPLLWRGFTGRPPRHPNCRCRVRPVWGDGQGAAAALRREARRSVVRGFSLPSESAAARLRAADRLLRRGAGLPPTVEDYGREAVRQGRFPRGRAVPTGAGRRRR